MIAGTETDERTFFTRRSIKGDERTQRTKSLSVVATRLSSKRAGFKRDGKEGLRDARIVLAQGDRNF